MIDHVKRAAEKLSEGFVLLYKDWNVARSILNFVPQSVALFIPLLGYAILFNDTVLKIFSFDRITGSEDGLNLTNIQMTYFGLILVALARLIYSARCHVIVRRHATAADYHRDELRYVHGPQAESLLYDCVPFETARDLLKAERDAEREGTPFDVIASTLYFELAREKPVSRFFCINIAIAGIVLLVIPSAHLFIRVLQSLF